MEVNVIGLALVLTLFWFIYRWLTKNHDYFRDKPIPSLAAVPFFGSTADIMLKRLSMHDYVKQVYDKFAGVKVFGLFDTNSRTFVITDLDLIKQISVKDFDYFTDRRPMFGMNDNDNPNVLFNKVLFSLKGQKWRDMRSTLSPAFTGSKMRAMFELIAQYSSGMIQTLRSKAEKEGFIDGEIKDLFSRIATDIIASCAFGLQVDSIHDPGNDFFATGSSMINFFRTSIILRVMCFAFFPRIMEKLGIDVIERKHIHFFSKIVKEAMQNREAHGIVRPDMIHLLMMAKKGVLKAQHETTAENEGFATVLESDIGKASHNKTLTDPEITAQCMLFFLAGFEGIASGMTFIAYELALSPEVQEKLYQEIVETNKQLKGQPLSYDVLQSMKYLDMVLSETLRMWPNPMIDRYCVKDYTLDAGDGLKFTIDQGTCVWFPVYGIHFDPKYYPNPTKFDPERFSEANRAQFNMAAYMPFGVGPRNCIGSRFALMEIKAIMYQLLLNFSIEPTEQTRIPLKLAPGLFPNIRQHLRLKLRQL
ncbi:probable cytochrome P450 9f2 [Wyeomyia smithii]|uniref:probable cytochrome P450 9f2 n=1 Tax=Wyeomyia smithii TaxID=174621 RepID=UPI002467D1AC|nr:probable cytochrome P450 9f2 [Wyeomyia smithii]